MDNELIVKNSITINKPVEKVWDALVNPEQTKKYMFGCETVSDWKPGSTLLWRMDYEGKEFVAVKGNVVSIEPGKSLTYTTFDPNNKTIRDIPENYLVVTYALAEENGQTLLTVTQGDYATVAKGKKRYEEAINAGGWNSILASIKKVVEESV